jgi:DNA (cytosine-5)-methyltransferase 1
VSFLVIDLFAGPGGLGEGFDSLSDEKGNAAFKIALSIECDDFAHRTLELRSFYRQFHKKDVPGDYYRYLRGEISREILFLKNPREADQAMAIAAKIRLGVAEAHEVHKRISSALAARGKNPWVLIGGPPCQAYSLVGRSRRRGECRAKFESDEKHLLYKQYLQIIHDHRPAVFVMENVKGILSAKLGGDRIFSRICNDLAAEGYDLYGLNGKEPRSTELFGNGGWDPSMFVVRSEDYGIPQARHRVFIVGLSREYFPGKVSPSAVQLLASGRQVTVEETIRDMPEIWSGLSSDRGDTVGWLKARDRGLKKAGYSRVASTMMPEAGHGGRFIAGKTPVSFKREWFNDARIKGVIQHESRTHMDGDVSRYAFAAAVAPQYGCSPSIHDFPKALLPAHKNVHSDEGETIPFADRFRVQMFGGPSTTITSHISKDGHYYIHPDPEQARSLTVREAARLQTFPDNYFFEGPRTQQYHQVGNAVPPLLAHQIAAIVHRLL